MRPQQSKINEVIGKVRARIKTRQVLFGVLITLAIAAVTFISAAVLANRFYYKPNLLVALRIIPFLLTLSSAIWLVMLPLRKRIGDIQIARLIEEKVRLDDRVTTAVEFAENEKNASPAILTRLRKDADERLANADLNRIVDPRQAYGYGAGALILLAALIGSMWISKPVSGGIGRLFGGLTDTASADAMFIEILPGNAKVPRGSDQRLKALLRGFDASVAQIFIRKMSDANWLATAMEPAKNLNEFQHTIFNIQDSIVYYVESNNIRSPEYTLEVADLPYVKQLDLVLNFPAFSGLPSKKIENGGEVAALKGTVVYVTAILSGKVKSARIVLNDGSKFEMSPDLENAPENEIRFVGSFTVTKEGTYKIEITSEEGEKYNGSNEYDITLLEDAPPTVLFDKPGRDAKVTNIQEVFTQARAEDDFGVAAIELFYQVNGGEEKHVALQDLKRDEPKTLTGSYTFFLEELGLQVGDFVSYYAKAKDNSGQESTSDIYFMEVRPFEREFRQSQQQGQGQGQGEQDSNALAKKQREIIAATFRVQREEKTYTPEEKDENFGTVTLSQEKLKGEADQLIERIRRRMGAQLNSNQQFAQLVEYLTKASAEMDIAKDKLREKSTKDALPPEQRALQQLLKAEAVFREMQIAQGQGQGQGQQQQDRDLADLFELQLDKMKNQYETVQRQQQSQQNQEQDELARKMEELSRRLQKELEGRQRSQMQQQGGGGGGSQRQQQEMIEELQKMARQLEKLSRDRRDQKMQEAAQQLRQAAEDLKRSQSQSAQSQNSQQSSGNQSDANSAMQRAQQRLQQAQRMMNSANQSRGQQNVQQLRQRAEEAIKKQNDIQRSVDELSRNGQSGNQEKKDQLAERKQTLADQVAGLEQDIDQTARNMGSEKQQAADKLRDAANAIRRNRIPDKIKQNKELIDRGYMDQAKEREKVIQGNLEEVLKNLQAAEGNANRRQGDSGEEAMNKAREIADSLESLRRKMDGQQGQQNQNGQPGERGQQNQQGGQPDRQNQQDNQQAQNGQQGNQRGNQQGQQQARNGQQGNQQGRNQQGRQQGNQQGQQANGRQQGGQQQGGQQSGQQGSRQQGQQQAQGGRQQGGQQQGGQQPGGQQGRNNQPSNSTNPEMQSEFMGGGGPPRTGDRQLDSELRQRESDLRELKQMLKNNPDLGREVDRAIDALHRINPNPFNDPAQMALLKSEIIDPLRQIEFELARRLAAKQGNRNGAINDGEAPDRYRKQIEDYYRRLSSRNPNEKK
ncbi:MAG: DUF4175 family protein [Acidobacteriota bacterium]